ncbi:YeeE/YedE thiosulfate transporter family protein [Methylobrevis albus]|uniref:YeeE/YedE family protein n=1 Tax=Methylobrevis albus TaxID=2793297 RepID=A0A931MX91_9HYPH|nr:YeeE/YedE thiosulfate transporter family protein [Methylobrevis albus]MBH0238643.1 YeeE/YedE family protein [Methylobrevis albus]
MSPILSLAVSFALAAVLGFAAHRASICTVRAVSELMSARTAYMLASVVKSALWVLVVAVPVLALTGGAGPPGWALTGWALLGGLLFGLGAGLNGACAYSTMARLVDGEAGMLLTILGFALGALLFLPLTAAGLAVPPKPAPGGLGHVVGLAAVLVPLLGLLAILELARLWRGRPRGHGIMGLVCARQYRMSTAAMLIGLAGGAVLVLQGPWGYTGTLAQGAEALAGARPPPGLERWLLIGAIFAGMALSTFQRGSFRPDLKPRALWLRHLAGGTAMGVGTALAPGGNDALVLYGMPGLSPHALPAYLGLLAGAAIGLLLVRHLLGIEMRVACRNDLFLTEHAPRPEISAHPVGPPAR